MFKSVRTRLKKNTEWWKSYLKDQAHSILWNKILCIFISHDYLQILNGVRRKISCIKCEEGVRVNWWRCIGTIGQTLPFRRFERHVKPRERPLPNMKEQEIKKQHTKQVKGKLKHRQLLKQPALKVDIGAK